MNTNMAFYRAGLIEETHKNNLLGQNRKCKKEITKQTRKKTMQHRKLGLES